MKYNPATHHRRSIRLKGFDYTKPGAYFVTICTYQRDEIFGEVIKGEMKLSALGEIVRQEWFRSAEIRKEIQLFDDEFTVMPNHLHGINWIVESVGADGIRPNDGIHPNNAGTDGIRPNDNVQIKTEWAHVMRPNGEYQDAHRASLRRTPRSLGSFIAGFKASVTSRARKELKITGIWQRNYYDHIVRNDRELKAIGWYILNNPINWQLDRDNAQNIRKLSAPESAEEYVKDVEEMALKLKTNKS